LIFNGIGIWDLELVGIEIMDTSEFWKVVWKCQTVKKDILYQEERKDKR
jgi:hypothetical protein